MDTADTQSAENSQESPLIWLVIGDKLGDNAQVEMIAAALGLPYRIKRLHPREKYLSGKPRFRPSLEHLDLERSDDLSPPWPDMVITVGRRHSMAALWIKQQSPGTILVLLGRPRRWIDRFGLVITLPQYGVPDRPNVMRLNLPLMRLDEQAIVAAVKNWQSRMDALPKPIIAVFIGGPTRPFRFDAEVTGTLLAQCRTLHERYGGTLFFSTSRRTPPAIIQTVRSQLPDGAILHEWRPDAADNPYQALLGIADYFVVSGDSVSMLIEVADCGKPMAIFPLPGDWRGRVWQKLSRYFHAAPDERGAGRLLGWVGRLLYKTGLSGFNRDLTRIHSALVSAGFAVYLGEPFRKPSGTLPNELGRISERILALLPKTRR